MEIENTIKKQFTTSAIQLEDDVMIDMDEDRSRKLALYQTENKMQMHETSVPVYFKFKDINYSVQVKEEKLIEGKKKKVPVNKQILHGISGYVQPGQVLAIIGSSGAGKTSLLDILANRTKSGVIEGEVMINEELVSANKKGFRRFSGYVYQDDCLKATLSVRETLMFYANLQLPPSVSTEEKATRVENLIDDLGLRKVADTRIGNEMMRGISGGERKRVAIGVQLIRDPSILYLDEPTSGLDAFSSLSVMQLLNDLAMQGKRTIITTIHQPRSTIFDLFDQLLILDGGKTVFFGPARDAASYFDTYLGFPVPSFINPADFFIDVVCGPAGKSKGIEYESVFKESPYHSEMAKHLEQDTSIPQNKKVSQLVLQGELKSYAASFPRQLAECYKRNLKDTLRNPLTSMVLVIQSIFMGLLVGSIFFGLDYCQSDVQNRTGVVFFLLINQAFSVVPSLQAFLQERPLFNRDRSAGVYSVPPYFLAKMMMEIPVNIVNSIITTCIAYWMTKLNPGASQFFTFLGIIFLATNVAAGIFSFLGCVCPSEALANILAPVSIVLFFLFGGFFINNSNIPKYYIWLHYSSFFKYAFEALMTSEFTGATFNCTDAEKVGGVCPIPNGAKVLSNYGFPDVVIWHWALVLLAMVFIYRFLAFLCLQFLYKEKR